MSLGVVLITHTNMGANPWDLLALKLSNISQFKIGTWTLINQTIMVVVLIIGFKQLKSFFALIPALLQGLVMNGVDSVSYFLPSFHYLVYLTIGSFLIACGFLMYTSQGIVPNAIDQFTITIKKNLDIQESVAKLLTDLIPIAILLLLGVVPHITSIYVYLVVPLFIAVIQKKDL